MSATSSQILNLMDVRNPQLNEMKVISLPLNIKLFFFHCFVIQCLTFACKEIKEANMLNSVEYFVLHID